MSLDKPQFNTVDATTLFSYFLGFFIKSNFKIAVKHFFGVAITYSILLDELRRFPNWLAKNIGGSHIVG